MKFEGMQRYTQYLNWYAEVVNAPRSVNFMGILTLLICLMSIVVIPTLVNKCDVKVEPKPVAQAQIKYEKVFKASGSTQPEVMAKAVLATKKPRLMAAIAIKESNGNPGAIGDNGASKGAFQVQSKHWGVVPNDAIKQALQSERILEELSRASRGRLRCTLAMYNGGPNPPAKSYRYADSVIKIARSL